MRSNFILYLYIEKGVLSIYPKFIELASKKPYKRNKKPSDIQCQKILPIIILLNGANEILKKKKEREREKERKIYMAINCFFFLFCSIFCFKSVINFL